jgi:hypothetical protein
MTYHHVVLSDLQNAFVKELQQLLYGKSLHIEKLKGQRWGLYKYPGRRGKICNMIERSQGDADFPHCPLPHLKIVIGNELARKAGAKPDRIIPGRWYGGDAAYWCIGTPNDAQFTRVAREISKIYHHVQ